MYHHFYNEPEARAFLEAHREEGAKAVVWGGGGPGKPFFSIFIAKKA